MCAYARKVRAPWYAVQVTAGREDRMRAIILRAVELEQRLAEEQADARADMPDLAESSASSDSHASLAPIVEELFVPKTRVGVKRGGKWLPGEEVLLPGYLIAVTADPSALAHALRRVRGFARVVSQDNAFVPLPEESVRWLEAQTQRGSAVVEMSEGYVEGGVLHVTSGPLVGREASVVKVNHRKKVAYLELEAFGRKITAQLGIRITRNRDCKKNLTTE